MLKAGIVGIAGYAEFHMKQLDEMERLGTMRLESAVVLPADRHLHRDRLSELLDRQIRIYDSLPEMAAEEKGVLDLICIPVGIDQHAGLSVAALNGGFHVICEKPAAGTEKECMEMIKARDESGKHLVIAYQHLYTPLIQNIRSVCKSGDLGKLIEARTALAWPRGTGYYSRNSWAGKIRYKGSPIYDSPLQNAGAHFLQNMLYAAGGTENGTARPQSVYAENYRIKNIESADTQYIRIETAEGAVLSMMATHSSEDVMEPQSDFFFEKGRIRWNQQRAEVYRQREGRERLSEIWENGEDSVNLRVFAQTARAIRGEEAPICPIDLAAEHIRCIEAAFQSSGGVHALPPRRGSEILRERGNSIAVIDGILPLLKEYCETGKSPWELGVPWAVRGDEIIGISNRIGERETT